MPAYEYEFNDRNAPQTWIPDPPFPMGAYHASEIQYVFQTAYKSADGKSVFSPEQQKLSDQIADYWIRFITSGDPGGTSPKWTPYRASDDNILSFAPDKVGYESDFATQHHCALWDALAVARE